MTAPANLYVDFKSLAALKTAAGNADPKALREAARQFESLFTQMLLKSMREASLNDAPFDGEQTRFYQEMFDNQIALQLSKGRGLGLSELLTRQLALSQSTAAANGDVKTQSMAIDPSSKGGAEGGIRDIQGVTPSAPNSIAKAPGAERRALAHSPAEFVAQLWPHAQAAGRALGVDARTLIAQAALETGWGKFVPCNPDGSCSFNLFGVKTGGAWRGASVGVNTLEYAGGVAVRKRDSFRAYASVADSFNDYAALIKNSPRYGDALKAGDDAAKFAAALQQGGYATDPHYARKLVGVANSVAALFKSNAMRPLASVSSIAAIRESPAGAI